MVWVWSSRSDVTLAISMPQKVFRLGDEIQITLTLTNKGKQVFPSPQSRIGRFLAMALELRQDESPSAFGLMVRKADGSLCVHPQFWFRPVSGSDIQEITVGAGETVSSTLTLNEWALMAEPGKHTIVGVLGKTTVRGTVYEAILRTEPVEIVVKSRTDEEMAQRIENILRERQEAENYEEISTALRKLVYTRDNRIVPRLLDLEYSEEGSDLVRSAFTGYLPIEKSTKKMILDAANTRGLTASILAALRRQGCSEEEMRRCIAVSLESENRFRIAPGVRGAIYYPNDSHTERLAELATSDKSPVPTHAMRALAFNGTKNAIRHLREMLEDPDEEIRDATRSSIEDAYLIFDASQEAHVVSLDRISRAMDKNNPGRWESIASLWLCLDASQVKALEGVIANPKSKIDDKDNLIRTFLSLLQDSDRDVRDLAVTTIRFGAHVYRGRPLRPEDFPEIYAEYLKDKEERN